MAAFIAWLLVVSADQCLVLFDEEEAFALEVAVVEIGDVIQRLPSFFVSLFDVEEFGGLWHQEGRDDEGKRGAGKTEDLGPQPVAVVLLEAIGHSVERQTIEDHPKGDVFSMMVLRDEFQQVIQPHDILARERRANHDHVDYRRVQRLRTYKPNLSRKRHGHGEHE